MRQAILALLAATGLAMIAAAPAEAVGTRYPYCIQGDDQPGLRCAHLSTEFPPWGKRWSGPV